MLHFNYTLDNELKVPVGRLPSGIQTQAFEMAMNRMGQKYRSTIQMVSSPVTALGGKTPLDGMSPGWQERIRTESAFLSQMPAQLMQRARFVALAHAGNAVGQSSLERNWNLWVDATLKAYGNALNAFQQEVQKAMGNATVNGVPASFVTLARLAKVSPPAVPNTKALKGLGFVPGVDDPQYLSGLEQPTPLLFGALAGLSLVGLAAWYFTRGAPVDRMAVVPPAGMGYAYY